MSIMEVRDVKKVYSSKQGGNRKDFYNEILSTLVLLGGAEIDIA